MFRNVTEEPELCEGPEGRKPRSYAAHFDSQQSSFELCVSDYQATA